LSGIPETRWFSWGDTVAVVLPDGRAFVAGSPGWHELNAADASRGRPISETEARKAFPDIGDRPLTWEEFLAAKTGLYIRPRREPEPNLPDPFGRTTKICWFEWGSTLAVVLPDGRAFSVQRNGWRVVSSADVLKYDDHERWQISEETARRRFSSDFEKYGDPPVSPTFRL
jgi:hypothetical protein